MPSPIVMNNVCYRSSSQTPLQAQERMLGPHLGNQPFAAFHLAEARYKPKIKVQRSNWCHSYTL